MDKESLSLLEFDKILNTLKGFLLSPEGENLLERQELIFSTPELDAAQRSVGDLKSLLESIGRLPDLGFPPIEKYLSIASRHGTLLEGAELVDIARYVESSLRLKTFLLTEMEDEKPYSTLLALSEDLPDTADTARDIRKVLSSDGNIRDDHPELRALRKKIASLHLKLTQTSSNYLTADRNLWQSDIPTQREGRLVLPLKSGFKGRIKGIIHGVSAKGTIIYIEPFDILELNNQMALEEHALRQIEIKILKDLTGKVGARKEELYRMTSGVAAIDTVWARARYAIRFNCSRPVIGERKIDLRKARHPLLGDNAVPIDISLSEPTQALIITGPNAGGKTVTLKTVGLLSVMHQFGMQIPAGEGSVLPVFDGIFADIGDDQSIEEALSTFSGHMKNIARILKASTGDSLVLLDELGSGTDPAEGAAIAMAVMDRLTAAGSMLLITSHHGLLKNYGYTRKKVSNASMDFDDTTLTPTYRVVSGLPGESHAMDIARSSGIPVEVTEGAAGYLSDEKGSVGEMIKELELKQKALFSLETEIKVRERRLKEEIRNHDLSVLKLRQREGELREHGYTELSKFMKESRKNLENLVRTVKEGELTKEKTKKVKDFIRTLEEKVETEQNSVEQNKARIRKASERANVGMTRKESLREGMTVLAGPGRRSGTLLRKTKKGDWVVSVGALKLTLPENELVMVESGSPGSRKQNQVSVSYSEVLSGSKPQLSLDIRGRRLEEALDALERQIDNALMSGLQEFSVIHGMGEGILQKGVHDFLRGHREVEDFFFSHPEEGGFGKTNVVLRGVNP